MSSSQSLKTASSPWAAGFFVLVIVGLVGLLPWLPALAARDGYYGLRVDQPAVALPVDGLSTPIVPAKGLAVVFFGYRHCGTVCPVQLSNLRALQTRLSGEPVRYVFVTLDPERDSRAALNRVMTAMGPDFVAVRPESSQAARALARQYQDYSTRQGSGPAQEITHSAHLHVLAPNGRRELLYTTPALDLDRVEQDLRRLISARAPG